MRKTFAVGRLNGGTAEIVMVDEDREGPKETKPESSAPFPGPWSLRALVRRTPSRGRGPTAPHSSETVH